jgi:hypothetical protein
MPAIRRDHRKSTKAVASRMIKNESYKGINLALLVRYACRRGRVPRHTHAPERSFSEEAPAR